MVSWPCSLCKKRLDQSVDVMKIVVVLRKGGRTLMNLEMELKAAGAIQPVSCVPDSKWGLNRQARASQNPPAVCSTGTLIGQFEASQSFRQGCSKGLLEGARSRSTTIVSQNPPSRDQAFWKFLGYLLSNSGRENPQNLELGFRKSPLSSLQLFVPFG